MFFYRLLQSKTIFEVESIDFKQPDLLKTKILD